MAKNEDRLPGSPNLGRPIKKRIPTDALRDISVPNNRSIDLTKSSSSHEPLTPKPNPSKGQIEEEKTKQAIDDIVLNESNKVLEAENAAGKQTSPVVKRTKKGFSFKKIFKNKWTYVVLILALLGVVFVWPYSRYKVLGLFLKNNYQFSIIDSTTGSPVGGALVKVDGKQITTSASGAATINLKVGKHNYVVSKNLYKSKTGTILVGILKSHSSPIKLAASGRQVTIKLVNKLTGQPVVGADISILSTSSTTGSNGQASLVLSTKSEAYLATISASGYVKQTTSILLTKKLNSFNMIPSGNLFFLANGSGLVNVMETNLDGSDPQNLVPGTGHENASTTSLIPSPDWKYLLLEANRNGTQPELYIINASSGDITEFDSSPDQFNLIGWNNDNFVYDETNQGEASSTVGREQLKSYDAVHTRLNILDQNQVNSAAGGYAYQTFSNFYLLGSEIVYITNWATSGTFDTSTLTTTIRGVQVSGSNKNDFQSFSTPDTGSISVVKNSPSSLYFSIANTSTNQTSYYQYTSGAVNQDNNLTPANFSQTYPKYFLSPSGSQSLWTQNNTYEGDQNGQNQKLIATANGYTAYSWYDNVYILLSKSSQLYIVPINGTYSPTLVGNFIPSAS